MSATLDDEATPLSETEIERHLAICPSCRAFGAGVSVLAEYVAPPETPSAPTARVLATITTARRGAYVAALGTVIARLRGRLTSPGVLAWALGAMALGVILPSVSLGALAHLHTVHPQLHHPCANLLLRHDLRTR